MRAWLKQQFLGSDWGFRILFPWVRTRNYFLEGGWRSDRDAIERTFLGTFGYRLDWDRPRTLNEKLNWMKLNVRDPRQRIAADKYAVREFVRERAGEDCLIPLLRVYDRAEDIRFAELPRSFVLKVNHGSGQNWIVRDQNQEDERRVVRQFREWMATSHYTISREWPYKDMRPRIVVEELLVDEGGGIPCDYKLHCFGGQAVVVQVDLDRETDHRRNFYDLDWNLLPFLWTEWEGNRPRWPNGRAVPRPERLPEMIRLAQILADGFPYVRIDLFDCRGRIFFGEITFYHGGGLERFDPPEYDRLLGDRLAGVP